MYSLNMRDVKRIWRQGMRIRCLLLLLQQANILLANEPLRTFCHRNGKFLAKNVGYALSGNILATNQVSSAVQCAFNCMENSQCKSYNYQHLAATQTHDCELLERTKTDASLVVASEYTHYETEKVFCKGLNCQNSGSCDSDCLSNQPRCLCTAGFEGPTCEVGVPPNVEIPPKQQQIIPHDTAIINCYSSRAEKFTWFKDGTVLNTLSTTRLNIFPNGSLEIKDFTEADDGDYHCNVSNPTGSNVSLAVNIIEMKPPDVRVNRDNRVTCPLFYSEITVNLKNFAQVEAWYKDGVEIDINATNDRLRIDDSGDLVFRVPQTSDSGNYSFRASNALGTVFSGVTTLKVLALCSFLDHPTNGIRRGGFRVEGYPVNIQCKFKYTMTGSESPICQADGQWSSPPPTCGEDTSNNHPVRLIGSTQDNEGRVEIHSGGQWGAIGHDAWDINDATVVCKQLGFPGALQAYSYSAFGEGTGPIFLTDVNCAGSESELQYCSFSVETQHCSHEKTAGVLCQNARLVAGGHHYGRLEVYTGGRWGTVCDDWWDMDDTHVLCKQLGFAAAISFGKTQSEGSGDIVMDNVECLGRESNLMHCSHLTAHNCGHHEDISVSCNPIRLAGSQSYREGRVEKMQENGAWGTVCDDLWDDSEAQVVCRMLRFPGYEQANFMALYGQGTGEIVYDDVQCTGSETYLWDCPRNSVGHNCAHSEDAGVVCQAHVRLAGSTNYYEGTVDAMKDGTWGTICDHLWDINDAHVVCRMLGFAGAVVTYSQAHFGEGSGTIHYDGLECDGTESHIRYCRRNPSGTCTHSADAGVRCQILRLAGADNSKEGRVELYKDNQWGTLCDSAMGAEVSAVICQQVGRGAYTAKWDYAYFGQGTGTIKMSDIRCTGAETSILECSHEPASGCSHANDISVRCSSATILTSTTNKGLIKTYRGNQWGRVCGNHWDIRDAEVACREAGYAYGALDAYVEAPDSLAWIRDSMHCEGHETSLIDCRQDSVGSTCTNYAGAVCQNLRLVGPTPNEGRLEIFHDSNWASICNEGWDVRDAHVACTQLGFEAGVQDTYVAGNALARTSGFIAVKKVACTGMQTRLHDCPYHLENADCTYANDVWVKCHT